MERNDNAVEKAIAYFEDAIEKTNKCIAVCTPALREDLLTQKRHFCVAVTALRFVAEKEDRNEGRKR